MIAERRLRLQAARFDLEQRAHERHEAPDENATVAESDDFDSHGAMVSAHHFR
jgi:hypothetical protein